MPVANETNSRICRFLNEADFAELYEVFIEAFSDYVFPFALDATAIGYSLQVINIDRSLAETLTFFEKPRFIRANRSHQTIAQL